MSCMNCLRWFVFALNLLFWLAGMGTLGVGLFLLFDPSVREYMRVNTNLTDYYVGVYILIAVGVIMSLLGFLGCLGALRKNQCLLVTFFILLFVIFCCQLACGILAYSYQNWVKKYVENSMLDAVYHRYNNTAYPKYTEAVDQIQSSLKCCGVHGYLDWLNSQFSTGYAGAPELGIGAGHKGSVPKSCCSEAGLATFPTDCGVSFGQSSFPLSTFANHVHQQGCSEALYNKLYDNLNLIIGVAIGIGAFQLLGMVLSMSICCWISKQKDYEYRYER